MSSTILSYFHKSDKYVYSHITNVMNTTARYIIGYLTCGGL